MKRSGLRRKPRARVDDAERISHELFREAARKQRCCQMCGTTKGGWHPHHVVYAQHLKREQKPVYDTRNAMRLCIDCHSAHHARSRVIPLIKLTLIHIEYAFLSLGAAAHTYLSQRYDGDDPRLEETLARFEGGDLDERSADTAAV